MNGRQITSEVLLKLRSAIDLEKTKLANETQAIFSAHGITSHIDGIYPAWQPHLASAFLSLCQNAHQKAYGKLAQTGLIHAGLECGIIGGAYPKMDMVSIGPSIFNAHAPGESVDIASVERTWALLLTILQEAAHV